MNYTSVSDRLIDRTYIFAKIPVMYLLIIV